MAPASKCGCSPVTSTGCTVAAPVVTIVLVPSKLPLDAAIATTASAATRPAAKPARAAISGARRMRGRLAPLRRQAEGEPRLAVRLEQLQPAVHALGQLARDGQTEAAAGGAGGIAAVE